MMQHSTVLIVHTALLSKANALGDALGHGPESYTIPLSDDGETVTHFGAHTYATEAFFATVGGAMGGSLPPVDWSTYGITAGDVVEVLASLIVSAPGSALDPEGDAYPSPASHFAQVVEASGLQVAA